MAASEEDLDAQMLAHMRTMKTTADLLAYLLAEFRSDTSSLIASYLGLVLITDLLTDGSVDAKELALFLGANPTIMQAWLDRWKSESEFEELLTILLHALLAFIRASSITAAPFAELDVFDRLVALLPANAPLPDLLPLFSVNLDLTKPKPLLDLLPHIRHPIEDAISNSALESAFSTIRYATQAWINRLHRSMLSLLKTTRKEQVLAWIDRTVRGSLDRAKIRVQPRPEVISDGQAMALWAVLVCLCEPFLCSEEKARLICDRYWEHSSRELACFVRSTDCTKLVPPADPAAHADGNDDDKPPMNFISDIFFTTLFATRIGPIRLIAFLGEVEREGSEMQQELDRLSSTAANTGNPMRAHLSSRLKVVLAFHRLHTGVQEQLSQMTDIRLVLSVYLTDYNGTAACVTWIGVLVPMTLLLNRLMAWMLHLVNPSAPFALSHSGSAGRASASLPEMATIECITEFFLFVGHTSQHLRLFASDSAMNRPEVLVQFVVLALRYGPSFIRNPYTRAKLAEIVHIFCDAKLDHLLDCHPAVTQDHLVPALLALYVDVESTGASSQFYEKFSIRHYISLIIRCLWERHPRHRERFVQLSEEGGEHFIRYTAHVPFCSCYRFVNLLINDVTYLLDESMTKLAEIHRLQANPAAATVNAVNDTADTAVNAVNAANAASSSQTDGSNAELQRSERICRSCMQLASESLSMLAYLTTAITASFVSPEFGDRLSGMLLLNIATLTGPRCRDLRVRDAASLYHFRPRELLFDMACIIVNMAKKQREFVRGMARDARSWTDDLLPRMARIMETSAGNPNHQSIAPTLLAIDQAVKTVRSKSASAAEAENEEIPDEFIDPLTYMLMHSPVRLRTSNVVLDRTTLKAHLLNDPHDPFNRKLIDVHGGDVVDEHELKAKIEQWREQRKRGAD